MLRPTITFVCLLSSGVACAITPATDRELLCNAAQIVEADVVSAKRVGCLTGGPVCFPDRVTLTLKITRVLAQRHIYLEKSISDNVFVSNQYQVEVNAFTPIRGLPEGALLDYQATTPLSDADVERAFKARSLVFGLGFGSRGTISAQVWLKNDKEWIVETLKKEIILPCPVLVSPLVDSRANAIEPNPTFQRTAARPLN